MLKRVLALVLALMCMCSFACAESLTDGLQKWLDEQTVAEDLQKWFDEEALPAIEALIPTQTDVETAVETAVTDLEKLFAGSTMITTVGTVVPDQHIDSAVITFSLKARGETVAEANTQVMQDVNAVRAALREQGVAENQVRQTRYDVSPNVIHHNTKLTDSQVISGYHVEITLKVDIDDLNAVGKVIDAAMLSGAQTSPDLAYECSDAAEAYYAALAQAARQAVEKARLMAESCGLNLGALVNVVETSSIKDGLAVVEVTYAAK